VKEEPSTSRAGPLTIVAVIDSPAERPAPVPVSVFVTVIAKTATGDSVDVLETTVIELLSKAIDVAVAFAGATELKTPRPKAATATSATRLKVVFVDMCFLSISRVREFLNLGLNQISLIRFDESHVLIHQIPHRVSGRGEETYLFVFHLHCLR
jgi:hypothetical protein